jgi:hypothetical protein
MRQRIDFRQRYETAVDDLEASVDSTLDSTLNSTIDSTLDSTLNLGHPLLNERDHRYANRKEDDSIFSSVASEGGRLDSEMTDPDSVYTDGEIVDVWEYRSPKTKEKGAEQKRHMLSMQQGKKATMVQHTQRDSENDEEADARGSNSPRGVRNGQQRPGRTEESERTISEAVSEESSSRAGSQSSEWSRLGARSWSRMAD